MTFDGQLEKRTREIGTDILNLIGQHHPGLFSLEYWHRASLAFLSHHEDLKKHAFRFVDVYPTLHSSRAIKHHLESYLKDPLVRVIPPAKLLFHLLKIPGSGWIAKQVAYAAISTIASKVIAGSSASKSVKRLKHLRRINQAFTVDLLGEFCVSEHEAEDYKNRYIETIKSLVDEFKNDSTSIIPGHLADRSPVCISVKLSALYSQTNILNLNRSIDVVSSRLSEIVEVANQHGVQVYCDAEDSGNNPIIYQSFYNVFGSIFPNTLLPGIVLQAYSKDSHRTFLELRDFVQRRGAPIAVRLVKGAYWDIETAIAKQNGWPSPLFSKKSSSDAQFEFLSRCLLDCKNEFLPALAGHNVRSLAHGMAYAELIGTEKTHFELQTLFGMADALASALTQQNVLVRQYVPLGKLVPGMGYLVRRLIENTSNEGFLRNLFLEHADRNLLLSPPFLEPFELQEPISEPFPEESSLAG